MLPRILHASTLSCLLAVTLVAGLQADEPVDDFAPSKETGSEVQALLKPGVTSDELHRKLKTTPAMVQQNRFHWQLADGSLWTDFVPSAGGARVIGWIIDSKSVQMQGGEALDLDRLYSHFYEQRDLESIPRIVELAALIGMLDADHSRRSFSTFLAEVFRANPQEVSDWVKCTQVRSLEGHQRRAVYSAIVRAELSNSQELLGRYALDDDANRDYIRELLKEKPNRLLDREIATPSDLDEIWSAFFATGDRRYVERICRTFSWDVSGLDRSSPRWLVKGAAVWSVGSNATRHRIVFDFCKSNAENGDPRTKPIYQKILQDISEKQGKGE